MVDPNQNPLISMFHTIASMGAVRAAAQSAAAVQAEHYKALVAEGVPKEVAMELAVKTADSLFFSASKIVNTLATNSVQLVNAFDMLSASAKRHSREDQSSGQA